VPRVGNLDRSIRQALEAFAVDALRPEWRGREREAISQFAFGHLLQEFNGRLPLYHPAQIGIEVCVPGVAGQNPKGRVNKDLVIWPQHRVAATWDDAWRPRYAPRCIMEWTYSRDGRRWRRAWDYDIDWLRRFTDHYRGCIGYAVALVLGSERQLLASRVQSGRANLHWLAVPPGRVV
jgi:hypothetical protein